MGRGLPKESGGSSSRGLTPVVDADTVYIFQNETTCNAFHLFTVKCPREGYGGAWKDSTLAATPHEVRVTGALLLSCERLHYGFRGMEVNDFNDSSSAPELRAALASLQARVQEQEALITKQGALLDTLIVEKIVPAARPREGLAAATARAVVAPSGLSSISSSAAHRTSGSILHRARRRFLSRLLPPPPTDAELADQDERADLEDKMENAYSYAMRVATGDAVPLRRRLQAVVLLMMLTAIQLIFAYTYADAASVMTVNQRYSANRDEVDFSLFYPDTCVTRSGSNGSFYALPKANLLASLASFFSVAFFMKDDTEATLKSVCPIDSLVWDERPTLNLRSAGSVLMSLLLQCLWNVRAVVIPSLAGAGIGLLMSVTRNAVDIVMNAIAIAFVFDLDELAYSWFVTKRMSVLYEELGPPVPRQHPAIRRRYCSLVYLLDAYCMSSIYLHWSLDLDLWGVTSDGKLQTEGLIRCYLYSRAWLVGLARCHLVLSARRSILSTAPIQALVRTVAYAGIMIGAMPFLAYYSFYLLAQWLGARRSVGDYGGSLNMEGANIKSCLEEVDDFVSCKDLHKSSSAFMQLTEKVCQGLSGSCAGKLPIWWSS